MSLIDTLTTPKRGPGRPPKMAADDGLSPVMAAVAAPLPEGLPDALRKVDALGEAFDRAKRARDDFASLANAGSSVSAAKAQLDRLEVRADIAGPMGTDGPTDEDLAAARQAYESAVAATEGRADRLKVYDAEIARIRAAYDAAFDAMSIMFRPWKAALDRAADEQIGAAIHDIGEVRLVRAALAPWELRPLPLRLPKIAEEGSHAGPDDVPLPPALVDFAGRMGRHFRALTR